LSAFLVAPPASAPALPCLGEGRRGDDGVLSLGDGGKVPPDLNA